MSSTSDRVDESTGSLDNYVLEMLSQPLGGIWVGLFHYGLCRDDSAGPLNVPHGDVGEDGDDRREYRLLLLYPKREAVYLRLQSSLATLKRLQKDEEEPKRPRLCMELVSKGFKKERLALPKGLHNSLMISWMRMLRHASRHNNRRPLSVLLRTKECGLSIA
ncbi:hypothetical protein Patl1_15382 [Pistacia atlantica]|uniref:Uncharacterized protein n=1 Tax=Pistacia atlantica TaxID=434234 RepID=A0ACC1B993_9ROSI|nr:hypothetical protein Patl1_15382 [Pistacia atlantica]